jgi:hypothetical protein
LRGRAPHFYAALALPLFSHRLDEKCNPLALSNVVALLYTFIATNMATNPSQSSPSRQLWLSSLCRT